MGWGYGSKLPVVNPLPDELKLEEGDATPEALAYISIKGEFRKPREWGLGSGIVRLLRGAWCIFRDADDLDQRNFVMIADLYDAPFQMTRGYMRQWEEANPRIVKAVADAVNWIKANGVEQRSTE